ncbi:MAG TPA: ATP-binding protein [Salinimicrobium sp.]|nr:ATP-binding protein [Salinimicrobium sp.]
MKKKYYSCFSFFLLFTSLFAQDSHQKIDSINNLQVQGLLIPFEEQVSLFKNNIEEAKTLSYEKGVADAHAKLAIVYTYKGEYEKSLKNSLQAIEIYDKLELYDKEASQYANLGYGLKYRDFNLALKYMQEGKSIAEAHDLQNELKNIYNNYGVLKEINKELDSALFYYRKGLEIKKLQKDSFGIPYSISNIAGIYGLKKQFSQSKKYFIQALEARKELKDSSGIAENYTQLGEVYMAENKPESALQFIHKSIPIAQRISYPNLEQYNYKLLSDIYKNLKNADSALHYYEQYNKIKDSIQSTEIKESLLQLTMEFDTEKKENQILEQRAQIAEKELEVKRKNTLFYGSLGLAFLLGLLGYLLFNQQKLKNKQLKKEAELKTALAKIEVQNKLQEQRLRISRDLHDNIGSQLTFIISSIDNVKYGFKDINEQLSQKLSAINNFTTQTIYELRDTIWAMNKNQITFEDLQIRISNFIEHANSTSSRTKFLFDIEEGIAENHIFTSVQGMNMYRIIQEAVNNALKYSDATKIKVDISQENSEFLIEIIDNGKGFDIGKIEHGNGFSNMKKRAAEIGGEAEIISEPEKGTSVRLSVPKK